MNYFSALLNLIHQTPVITLYLMIIVGFIAIALVLLILALIFTRKKSHIRQREFNFAAISGEDVIATRLDLAKAYLEMNKKQSAKELLRQVIKQGNPAQKNEARQLILEV